MVYRIVFHAKAEAELEQLYDDITKRASPAVAWNFVAGIRDHCLG
ncbi:MAG: type II toxin-antitoxin system RelE/ParE family toxin, partial [Mesorhizobium sp.]